MSAIPKHKWTVAEYLAAEQTSEVRHEFFNGEIFAMAGASPEHNTVKENCIGEMFFRLKNTPCRSFSTDQRVKIPATGLYTYPDILIVCGRAEFDAEDPHSLINPQVIFEILSPSTESYDRGTKFHHFQKLPSVKEYVLISQDKMQVERFVRQPNDSWLLTTFDDVNGEFALTTVPVTVLLADLYRGVEIPELPSR